MGRRGTPAADTMSDEEAAELGLPPGPANPGVLRRAQNRVVVTTDSITMRYKPQLLIAHAVAFILTYFFFCMIEDFPPPSGMRVDSLRISRTMKRRSKSSPPPQSRPAMHLESRS